MKIVEKSKVIIWCYNHGEWFSFHNIYDPVLRACVQNVQYFTTICNEQLEGQHILGKNNISLDALSGWYKLTQQAHFDGDSPSLAALSISVYSLCIAGALQPMDSKMPIWLYFVCSRLLWFI